MLLDGKVFVEQLSPGWKIPLDFSPRERKIILDSPISTLCHIDHRTFLQVYFLKFALHKLTVSISLLPS